MHINIGLDHKFHEIIMSSSLFYKSQLIPKNCMNLSCYNATIKLRQHTYLNIPIIFTCSFQIQYIYITINILIIQLSMLHTSFSPRQKKVEVD